MRRNIPGARSSHRPRSRSRTRRCPRRPSRGTPSTGSKATSQASSPGLPAFRRRRSTSRHDAGPGLLQSVAAAPPVNRPISHCQRRWPPASPLSTSIGSNSGRAPASLSQSSSARPKPQNSRVGPVSQRQQAVAEARQIGRVAHHLTHEAGRAVGRVALAGGRGDEQDAVCGLQILGVQAGEANDPRLQAPVDQRLGSHRRQFVSEPGLASRRDQDFIKGRGHSGLPARAKGDPHRER